MTEPAPWWTRSTVYQIYPRSFADSNGDGIGDLRGILDRLDHLEQLGVDVIWLSPVYPSPQADNGYDISDYRDIDPVFGTLTDFDELLAGVHDRGMKLVMDLVVNHTSDQHEWFARSRSSTADPQRDWYWWRPARPGAAPGEAGAEPTNWESFFSGPTWTFDPTTGEYFLHLFAPQQPDLNWENPDVRAAVYEMMRWWVDRGIDGFRMDVINLVSKDPALPDGVVRPGRALGDGWPYFVCGPRIHEFMAEMRAAVWADLDRPFLTVGETPGAGVGDAQRFTDPARGELDMVFQFDHVSVDRGVDKWDVRPLDLPALKRSLDRWQTGLAEVGWNSLYWNNHDQPRAVSRYGDDGAHRVRSAKALATVLHLQRGTPYVYQGEEIGMTNTHLPTIADYQDVETRRYHDHAVAAGGDPASVLARIRPASRDNARTPMQWDASPHAGFTTGVPWLAVNDNHTEINAAAAVADPHSVFHHYRRLIALRRQEPVIAVGDVTPLLADHDQVYAYRRALVPDAGDAGGDDGPTVELLVLANLSGRPAAAALDDVDRWRGAEVLITNVDGDPVFGPGGVELRPWEAVALRLPAR